jgi:tryptophan synthase alpha chain
MSRITELFRTKTSNILNVYCTAGYPYLDSTLEVMKALQENGADMIELGIPYSDPLADGPVIQMSNAVALQNGMTIAKLFEQIRNFREQVSLPVLLMGYLNPVLQYGFEKFCLDALESGIDGLIIPDLPDYEFEKEYGPIIKKYALDFVFLITPETSLERVKKLDELSSGFLYAVSSSATTGSNIKMDEVGKFLRNLQTLQLKNPVLAGFGIKDKDTFTNACTYANGAIIGSAFINNLKNSRDIAATTRTFLTSLLS